LLSLVGRALAQNTPASVINHAGGRHAFEIANDDDATREVMERTLSGCRGPGCGVRNAGSADIFLAPGSRGVQ